MRTIAEWLLWGSWTAGGVVAWSDRAPDSTAIAGEVAHDDIDNA